MDDDTELMDTSLHKDDGNSRIDLQEQAIDDLVTSDDVEDDENMQEKDFACLKNTKSLSKTAKDVLHEMNLPSEGIVFEKIKSFSIVGNSFYVSENVPKLLFLMFLLFCQCSLGRNGATNFSSTLLIIAN